MLTFQKITDSNLICRLDLDQLYTKDQVKSFNDRWQEFYKSDPCNQYVFKRERNIITYPYKFWLPDKKSNKPTILIFGGNPAPHSTWKDIYYAYEGKGIEHRFWKVLRELGYADLSGNDPEIKNKFLNLEYNSPFKLGFEASFTFPSTASKPKWSGVMGLEKLFGRKAFKMIYEIETTRVKNSISQFFKGKGAIIAMQKDAYNAISKNVYSIKLAVENKLQSDFNGIKIYGTPPTRWLHTKKMKSVLSEIRDEIKNLPSQSGGD